MAGGAANMQGIGQAGTQGGMPTGGAGQPGTQSGMPMPTNFIGMGGGAGTGGMPFNPGAMPPGDTFKGDKQVRPVGQVLQQLGTGGGFPQSMPQAPQQVQQATGFVNPDQRPGLTPEQIRAMTSTPAPLSVQQAAAQQAMPPGMAPQSRLFDALQGGQMAAHAPQSVQQAAMQEWAAAQQARQMDRFKREQQEQQARPQPMVSRPPPLPPRLQQAMQAAGASQDPRIQALMSQLRGGAGNVGPMVAPRPPINQTFIGQGQQSTGMKNPDQRPGLTQAQIEAMLR